MIAFSHNYVQVTMDGYMTVVLINSKVVFFMQRVRAQITGDHGPGWTEISPWSIGRLTMVNLFGFDLEWYVRFDFMRITVI